MSAASALYESTRGAMIIHDDPAAARIIERLRAGEAATIRARGGSMWPWVRNGALLRAFPAELDELAVGDLVVVERRGSIAIHRAQRLEADHVVCAGDALASADPRCPANAVLGRAHVVHQPALRWRLPTPTHLRIAARGAARRAGAALAARARLASHGARPLVDAKRAVRGLEAVIRKRLPYRLGGRVPPDRIRAVIQPRAAEVAAVLGCPTDSVQPSSSDRDHHTLGLEVDGALVAVGSLCRQFEHLGIDAWWFAGARVAPAWRRRGLGIRLHLARLELARALGVDTVFANVARDNAANLRALSSTGFRVMAPSPEWAAAIERHYRAVGSGRSYIQLQWHTR